MDPNNPDNTTPPETPEVPTTLEGTDTPGDISTPDTPETPDTFGASETPEVQDTPVVGEGDSAAPVQEEAPTPFAAPAPETPEVPASQGPTPFGGASDPVSPFAAAPAPEVPATPVAAAPIAPATNPVSQGGGKGNGKKLAIILGSIGGVILLALIGAILYFTLGSVTKEDYRDAAKQFNNVQIAGTAFYSDVSSLSYSLRDEDDTTFNDDLKAAQESIDKVRAENETLSKLKAVRVGDGAKLYKTFNDKLDQYLTNGGELIESVKQLRPAMLTCAKISDATDANARVTALKTCSTALGQVGDLPNEQFKTYAAALKDNYAAYATTYEKIAALTNPYGSQYDEYKTLRDQMYDTQDKISAASKTFTSDLDKRDKEVSVEDSSKALANYLNEQQR